MEGGFKLLAKPQTLFSVNFEDPAEIASLIEGKLFSLKFDLEEDGRLDCLAAWFRLDLGHGQTISTAPELGNEGCWEQALFRPPGPGSSRRLHRGDLLEAEFLVKKHVVLQQVEVSPGASVVENGVARPTTRSRQQLVLPPSSLKLLSDPAELSVSQWLAYNLVTSGHATKILHFSSWMPPISALQVAAENIHKPSLNPLLGCEAATRLLSDSQRRPVSVAARQAAAGLGDRRGRQQLHPRRLHRLHQRTTGFWCRLFCCSDCARLALRSSRPGMFTFSACSPVILGSRRSSPALQTGAVGESPSQPKACQSLSFDQR